MDDSLTRHGMTPAFLRTIEEAMGRGRRTFGLMDLEMIRAAESYVGRASTPSLDVYEMEPYRRQFRGLDANLERFSSAIHRQLSLQPSLLQGLLEGVQRAERESVRWGELTRSLTGTRWTELATVSSGTWAASVAGLTESLRAAGMADRHPILTERLLAPYDAYSRFARRALQSLEQASPEDRVGLSAAVVLGMEEISTAESIVEETLDEEWGEESNLVLSAPRPNAFRQLRSDLIVIQIPADVTPIELVSFSPTADLMEAGRRFAALVTECNTTAEMYGNQPIFSYTATMVEALHSLPFTVATDRDGLARVVDALYFILYEGAGTDKLRYLTEGLLTDAECDIVWRVKHLRNKWLRHDPERGKASDVRKSRDALREALHVLGAQGLPRRKDDYVKLHRELVARAIVMLESLSDRLRVPTK